MLQPLWSPASPTRPVRPLVLMFAGVSLALGLGCSPDSGSQQGPGVVGGGAAGSTDTTPPDTTTPVAGNGNPDTPTTPVTGGSNGSGSGCQAGHYVGGFDGTYRSPADPGASIFQFDLMIQSFENIFDSSQYGLELWLEEADGEGEDCSLGTEFCVDYVVSGGKIKGTANAYLLINAPFEIDLTGELDCTQGRFRGRLENGWYEVFGERYAFSGNIEADYNQGNFSFENGAWDVAEHDVAPELAPPAAGWGGEGTWRAMHNP